MLNIYFKFYYRTFNYVIMNGLHVDSVIKSFDAKQILTDVFLSCKKGEIIGLLGRNGSGKSTLLKIIFGSLPAERKFIKAEGTILNNLFQSHIVIKYLPQFSFLPNHIKVNTIINLFCDKENSELIKANKFFKHLLNKRSKELSGGEKRLLEIFLIVYSDAKYILIDEPFNGIAPVYKNNIKEIILEQSQQKGFVITDHDYRNVLDFATKLILIYDGGTRVIKNTDDLKNLGYLPV